MGRKSELRLHHLNLPDEIVAIARTHRDLPPKARDAVESAIARYQGAIASIDDQVASLVMPRDYYIRQDLREERASLQESLRACQSLFSTMRRIPFETMGEIFAYYLAPGGSPIRRVGEAEDEEPVETDADARFHAPQTPGLLCLVCQHWKTIAFGTPSLWSHIKVKAFHIPSGIKTYQATPLVLSTHTRGLLAWMDRVASHQWTLTRVDGDQSAMSTKPWDLTGAVPLSQLMHRRASAYISRLSVASWESAIGLGELVCPRITSLVSYNPNSASPQPTLLGLPVMDNLKRAVLWTNLPDTLPSNIPWPKLTHLFLGGDVSVCQWKSVIRHCTSLQKGMFSLLASYQLSDEDNYPIYACPNEVTLPQLKHLTFLKQSPFDAPIHGLSLPALTTLKVFSQWAEPPFNAQSDLFQNITHLTMLQRGWMEGEDLIRTLSDMPRLSELLFRVTPGFKTIFDFLTFGRDGKFNLRRLRVLGMYVLLLGPEQDEQADGEGEDSMQFSQPQLADFINSRTQAIRRGDLSSPHSLCQLERFVLRLEANCDVAVVENKKWMEDTAAAAQDVLKPYTQSCGLKASVFVIPKTHIYEVYDPPDLFYLKSGSFQEKRLAHWDEGFADPVDNREGYSLYPS